ncbi:hypothetical protein X777_00784, partial [Ooceraea biroi]
ALCSRREGISSLLLELVERSVLARYRAEPNAIGQETGLLHCARIDGDQRQRMLKDDKREYGKSYAMLHLETASDSKYLEVLRSARRSFCDIG